MNKLLKKVKAISTKGLTKDLINKVNILNGEKYFSSKIFENYLVFIPAKKYIKYFSGSTRIHSWKSNGMSEKILKKYLNQTDNHLLPDITFNGQCLINNNISIPKKVINLYISYTLTP